MIWFTHNFNLLPKQHELKNVFRGQQIKQSKVINLHPT